MMSDQSFVNISSRNGAMKVTESKPVNGRVSSAISTFQVCCTTSNSSQKRGSKSFVLVDLQRNMSAQKEKVKDQSCDEKAIEALKLQLQGVEAKIMTTTNVRAKLADRKESLLKEIDMESKQVLSKRKKLKSEANVAKHALKLHHAEYNVYRKLYNALKHPDDEPAMPVSDKVAGGEG